MAEKLNRDRSTTKQTRSTSANNDQNQNSSLHQFSSNQRGYTDIHEPTLRKRDTHKSAGNYPPLDDYAE